MRFFVDHLRRYKPPSIFKPQFALFALNHKGILWKMRFGYYYKINGGNLFCRMV